MPSAVAVSAPPADALRQFAAAVDLVMDGWTALGLAREQRMAGVYTDGVVQDFIADLVAFFAEYGSEVRPDEMARNIVRFFDEAFDVVLEDGSPEQVGQTVCALFGELVAQPGGDSPVYAKLLSRRASAGTSLRASHVECSSDSDSEGDSDNDMDDSSADERPTAPVGPEVDDDGFTLVQRRGRR